MPLPKLAIVSCIGLGIQSILASKASYHDARDGVLDWLSRQPDFFVSDKLALRDGNVIADDNVEVDEVLLVVPGSVVIAINDVENGEENTFCRLYSNLKHELDLKEKSKYALYLKQIQQEQATDDMLPSLWSNTGQRLLEIVSMAEKVISVIDDYSHCIEGFRKEDDSIHETSDERSVFGTFQGVQHNNRAITVTAEMKNHELILALAVKHQIGQKYFVPLYDQLEHHQFNYNTHHTILEDNTVRVVAGRSITAGERFSRPSMGCLEGCENFENSTFDEVITNYGVVQPYPHHWKLHTGASLIYHGRDEGDSDVGRIEWIDPPKDETELEDLQDELEFQRLSYELEVLESHDTVDEREWMVIDRHCQSLMEMLEDSISEGTIYLQSVNNSISDHRKKKDRVIDNKISESSDDEDDTQKFEQESDCEHTVHPSRQSDESLDGYPWRVNGCDLSENCTIDDIHDSRGCGETYNFDAARNQTEWVLMRSAYIGIVGSSQASLNLTYGSGIKVPYKVGHSPGRGRGVFATADIPKGTVVWTSDFTATFTNGVQFRKFLSVLPDDIVCDLILWCYTCKEEDGITEVIECDLDEASLFNSFDYMYEYNIGNLKGESQNPAIDDTVYAMRDIVAGEELVTAYDEFDTENYQAFGLD